MALSKLDAAEQQIVAAVTLLFDGSSAVPVYTLAAASREVTTALCEQRGVGSFFDIVSKQYPSLPRKDLYRIAHKHASFFKHADRDAEATLEDFDAVEADAVLFAATFDFGKLTGGNPIEAQVFQAWFLSLHLPPKDLPDGLNDLLPGIREMSRDRQLALGRALLKWARATGTFEMSYSTRPLQ